MSSYRRFEVQVINDVTTLHLADARLLDPITIREVTDELLAYAENERPNRLVVNFGQVKVCGSEIMGAMIRLKKRVDSGGGLLKLCGMSEFVREGYKIAGLDGTLLTIYDSHADAVNAF